jgi:hypothetical protein
MPKAARSARRRSSDGTRKAPAMAALAAFEARLPERPPHVGKALL